MKNREVTVRVGEAIEDIWVGTILITHSSTLSWKIPWVEEPGKLQSMGSQRVGHDWSSLAAAVATVVIWQLSM